MYVVPRDTYTAFSPEPHTFGSTNGRVVTSGGEVDVVEGLVVDDVDTTTGAVEPAAAGGTVVVDDAVPPTVVVAQEVPTPPQCSLSASSFEHAATTTARTKIASIPMTRRTRAECPKWEPLSTTPIGRSVLSLRVRRPGLDSELLRDQSPEQRHGLTHWTFNSCVTARHGLVLDQHVAGRRPM